MRKSVEITCPHCGEAIQLLLSKGRVELDTSFFDTDEKAVQKVLQEMGIEFGSAKGDRHGKD